MAPVGLESQGWDLQDLETEWLLEQEENNDICNGLTCARPNPWNLEVWLCLEKKFFADAIKDLEMWSSWIIGVGPECDDKCPYQGKAEEDVRQKRRRGEEEEATWPWRQILKWWDHKSRNTNSHHTLQDAKNGLFPGAPRRNNALLRVKTSGFQNCERQNSVKSPNLG